MNKKVVLFKSLSLAMLIVALVLEALPFGAVLIFVPDPSITSEVIIRYYSYFDFTPFGYANFAPFITAVLTVMLTALCVALIFVKRQPKQLRAAQFGVTLAAAVISVCPIFYGIQYVTLTGVFITVALAVSAVFCGISNATLKKAENVQN